MAIFNKTIKIVPTYYYNASTVRICKFETKIIARSR